MSLSIKRGTVKWWDRKKGYGFLLDEDLGEVFVHYTVIQGEGEGGGKRFKRLVDGEVVEYELAQGAKGFHATHVWRITCPAEHPARVGP